MVKQINQNDVDVHECTFQGHFIKAKLNLRFPCSFFIQWRAINGKSFIQSINRYKAKNSIVQFNETLAFSTQMLWDKRQKTYLKKDSIIKVNLVSASRPDQVKLVGQLNIDLSQITNAINKQIQGSKKLAYCSVDAELMFEIKLIETKRSQKSLNQLDKSTFTSQNFVLKPGPRTQPRSRSHSRQSRQIIDRIKQIRSQSTLKNKVSISQDIINEDNRKRDYIVIQEDHSRSPSTFHDETITNEVVKIQKIEKIGDMILTGQFDMKSIQMNKAQPKSDIVTISQQPNIKGELINYEHQVQRLQQQIGNLIVQLQRQKQKKEIQKIESQSRAKAIFQTTIQQMQKKLREKDAQIVLLSQQTNFLKSQLSQAYHQTKIKQGQLQQSLSRQTKLQNSIQSMKLQSLTLSAEIQTLKSQKQEIERLNQQYDVKLSESQSKIIQCELKIKQMEQVGIKKDQKINGIQQLLRACEKRQNSTRLELQNKYQQFMNDLNIQKLNNQSLLEELNKTKQMLSQKLSECIKPTLQAQKQNIVNLTSLNNWAEEKILLIQQKQILQSQIEVLLLRTADLQKQNELIKNQKQQQTVALNALNEQNFKLQMEIMDLKGKIQQAYQNIPSNKADLTANPTQQIPSLKEQIQSLQQKYMNLVLQYQQKQLRIQQLQSQPNIINEKIQLQNKIQFLQQQINTLLQENGKLERQRNQLSDNCQELQFKVIGVGQQKNVGQFDENGVKNQRNNLVQQLNVSVKQKQMLILQNQGLRSQLSALNEKINQLQSIINSQTNIQKQNLQQNPLKNTSKQPQQTNQKPSQPKTKQIYQQKLKKIQQKYKSQYIQMVNQYQSKIQALKVQFDTYTKQIETFKQQIEKQATKADGNLNKSSGQKKQEIAANIVNIQPANQLSLEDPNLLNRIKAYENRISQLQAELSNSRQQLQTSNKINQPTVKQGLQMQFCPKMKQIQYKQQQHQQPIQQQTLQQNHDYHNQNLQIQSQNTKQPFQQSHHHNQKHDIRITVNQVASMDESHHSNDHKYILTEDDYLPHKIMFKVSRREGNQVKVKQNFLNRSFENHQHTEKINQQLQKAQSQQNMRNSVISLNQQYEQKLMKILELEQKVLQLQKQNQALNKKLQENRNELSYAGQNGQAKIQELYNKINELQEDLKIKDQIMNDMQENIKQAYTLKFQLSQVLQQKGQLQNIVRSKDQKINELQQNISQLKITLQSNKTNQQNSSSQANSQHQYYKTNFLSQSVREELETRLNQAVQNNKLLDQIINHLKGQNNLLNDDLKLIREQTIQAQQDCLSYKQQNHRLQQQNSQLRQHISILQAQANKYKQKTVVLGQDNLMLKQQLQLHEHNSQRRQRRNSLSLSTTNKGAPLELPSIQEIAQRNQSQYPTSVAPESVKIESQKNQRQQIPLIKDQIQFSKKQSQGFYYEAQNVSSQGGNKVQLTGAQNDLSGQFISMQKQLNDMKIQLQILRDQLICQNKEHNKLKDQHQKILAQYQQLKKLFQETRKQKQSLEVIKLQLQGRLAKQKSLLERELKTVKKQYDQYRETYQNEVNNWIINKEQGFTKSKGGSKLSESQSSQLNAINSQLQTVNSQLNTANSQLNALKSQKQKLQTTNMLLTNSIQELKQRLIQVQNQLIDAKSSPRVKEQNNNQMVIQIVNKQNTKLKQQNNSLKEENMWIKQENNRLLSQTVKINQQAVKLKQQTIRLNQQVIQLNKQISQQKQSIHLFSSQSNSKGLQLNEKILLLETQKQQLQHNLQKSITQNNALSQAIKRKEENIKELQTKVAELNEATSSYQNKILELQIKCETINSEVQMLKAKEQQALFQSQNALKDLSEHKVKISTLQTQINSKNFSIDQLNQKILQKQLQLEQQIRKSQEIGINAQNQYNALCQQILSLQLSQNSLKLNYDKLVLQNQHIKAQAQQKRNSQLILQNQHKEAYNSVQQYKTKYEQSKSIQTRLQQQIITQMLNLQDITKKNIQLSILLSKHQTRQKVMKDHLQMLQQQSQNIFNIVKEKQIESEKLYQVVRQMQDEIDAYKIEIIKLEELVSSKDNMLNYYENQLVVNKIAGSTKNVSVNGNSNIIVTPKDSTKSRQNVQEIASKTDLSLAIQTPLKQYGFGGQQNKQSNTQNMQLLLAKNSQLMSKNKEYLQILSRKATLAIDNQKLKNSLQKASAQIQTLKLQNQQSKDKLTSQVNQLIHKNKSLSEQTARLKSQLQISYIKNDLKKKASQPANQIGLNKVSNQKQQSLTQQNNINLLQNLLNQKNKQIRSSNQLINKKQNQIISLRQQIQNLAKANDEIKAKTKDQQVSILQLKSQITEIQSGLNMNVKKISKKQSNTAAKSSQIHTNKAITEKNNRNQQLLKLKQAQILTLQTKTQQLQYQLQESFKQIQKVKISKISQIDIKKQQEKLIKEVQTFKQSLKNKQIQINGLRQKIVEFQKGSLNKIGTVSQSPQKYKTSNNQNNSLSYSPNSFSLNNLTDSPLRTDHIEQTPSPSFRKVPNNNQDENIHKLSQVANYLTNLIGQKKTLDRQRNSALNLLITKNKQLQECMSNFSDQTKNKLQQKAREVSRQLQKIKSIIIKTQQLNTMQQKSKIISSMKFCENMVLELIKIVQQLRESHILSSQN